VSAGAVRPTTPGCESFGSAPDDAVALERGDELKAVVVQEAEDRHFALGRQAAQVELDLTTVAGTRPSAVSRQFNRGVPRTAAATTPLSRQPCPSG